MSYLRCLTSALIFLLYAGASGAQVLSSQAHCHGRWINPATDINWRMVFPIRISGVSFNPGGGSRDSLKGERSAICVCPSHILGLPIPGLVVSFHQPRFIEEISTTPGCLSSLGGLSVLSNYSRLHSEIDTEESMISRFQIHWYVYPIFSMLGVFKDFYCAKQPPFSLAYISEIDPTWQDDEWGAVYAPEGAAFANATSQASCRLDAVAASAGHPLDSLFWCAGSWGPAYPLTGNANSAVGRIQAAELVGAKFIAKLAHMGALWKTVGKEALCHKQPMPIWIKSEFSIDPVYPTVYRGRGIPIGAAPITWGYQPVQSLPGYETINQVIFQEIQCCVHP